MGQLGVLFDGSGGCSVATARGCFEGGVVAGRLWFDGCGEMASSLVGGAVMQWWQPRTSFKCGGVGNSAVVRVVVASGWFEGGVGAGRSWLDGVGELSLSLERAVSVRKW